MKPLPIDPLLPEIVATLEKKNALVLEAPPGAGKTTRVPRALLDASFLPGEILVLQPRRLPTRLAAERVAEELGESPGRRVGYAVRFEEVSSAETRLRFLTEGILTRRLLSDPELHGVSAVILDEFHERHLASDLALSLLRRLQKERRPELRLVAMSATLSAEPVAAFLGDAPSLRSEGRRFDVAVEHLEKPDDRPQHEQVRSALRRLLREGLDGDVLVFLPGAGEIRRAQEALAEIASEHRLALLPLHGDLPLADQHAAVRPADRRKVILSTNVAETSVTIEGIAAVIDTGLARVAAHSPFSGLPQLKVQKVSRASAIQRAGRAGRTREGRALRLYTRHDFESRPEHDPPEIARLDLAELLLALHGAGVEDPSRFEFFEAPPAASLQAAEELLLRLGALDGGRLTETGRRMLRMPLHPRLGRLLLEGERRGVAKEAATVAALLSERDILLEARSFGQGRGGRLAGSSDLLHRLERYEEAKGLPADRQRSRGLDPRSMQTVGRAIRQLQRLVRDGGKAADEEEALLQSILAAFPDRVAKRRSPTSRDLLLAFGGAVQLSETSVVHDARFLVAVDVEERSARPGMRGLAHVRLASSVEPEWLLELDGIEERDERVWNAEAQRVDRIAGLYYGAIALDETRGPAPPSPATAAVLAEQALSHGIERFAKEGELANLLARIELLASCRPELELPSLDESALAALLADACAELRSFAELREAGLVSLLVQRLSPRAQRLLVEQVPERIVLPGGRAVPIHYERGQPPWIESRLQDFFGMSKGPAVCGGRVPLTLHLLAPNQRAVQVTSDLAGFWERHYPALRKELGRRYPKHAWPEDGATAQPPKGGRPR